MLTERQINLLKTYGKRFVDRSGDIDSDLLHLADDAACVLTNDEWRDCAKALTNFLEELSKVRGIVFERLEEAGVEL